MFRKPTTIILGAGASCECGLPLGGKLLASVAQALDFRFDMGRLKSGDSNLYELLKRRHATDIERFTKAGKRLSLSAGRFVSIDEALYYFGTEEDVVEVGKLAIVQTILSAENKSPLAISRETGRVNIENVRDNWLNVFFSMAIADLRKEDIASMFTNVSFINFNYDRTLECYLFHALTSTAHVEPEVAADIIEKMRVIRPYGSLGALDWRRRPHIGGHIEDDTVLREMASRIRTFTEAHQENLQTQITETLDHSKLVIILGFGFHQQNMALLKRFDKARAASVFATAKHIHKENLNYIRSSLMHAFNAAVATVLDMTANELLSELRPSILAAA